MSYSKNIEQYKIRVEFNTPLAIDKNIIANCNINDDLFIIDGEVYIKHKNDTYEQQFFRTLYDAEFVKINPLLFRKVL